MSETLDRLKQDRRDALRGLLDQCTKKQQALFNKMYGSIDVIPDARIDWAIKQCEKSNKRTAL